MEAKEFQLRIERWYEKHRRKGRRAKHSNKSTRTTLGSFACCARSNYSSNDRAGGEKLRQKGIKLNEIDSTLDQLDEAHVTAITAPLIIRGVIVKELVARGIMTPEADKRVGIDTLLEAAEDFKKQRATDLNKVAKKNSATPHMYLNA